MLTNITEIEKKRNIDIFFLVKDMIVFDWYSVKNPIYQTFSN